MTRSNRRTRSTGPRARLLPGRRRGDRDDDAITRFRVLSHYYCYVASLLPGRAAAAADNNKLASVWPRAGGEMA